jgi:hypothetical protein
MQASGPSLPILRCQLWGIACLHPACYTPAFLTPFCTLRPSSQGLKDREGRQGRLRGRGQDEQAGQQAEGQKE